MRGHTRSTYATIYYCIAVQLVLILDFCLAYQAAQTACGQSVVYVAGKYRYVCVNGYIDDAGACIQYNVPECPAGYTLVNSQCYLHSQLDGTQLCPNGYRMQNGLCYPIAPIPCNAVASPEVPPLVADTTTLPPQAEATTVPPQRLPKPVPKPPAAALTRCPPGSIFMDEMCRKLICFEGEYHHGRCLEAACPEGTVWRGRRCQPPGYVTTILEIENVFINEAHHQAGEVFNENVYNVHTPSPTEAPASTTTSTSTTSTTDYPPAQLKHTTSTQAPRSINEDGCCSVITPRVCKLYEKKWVCFNRRFKRCDPKICTSPLIYLKVSEVFSSGDNPPVLVIPPNPPLEVCKTPNCDGSDTVDCSGCIHSRRESCSSYCYAYMCPQGTCRFMKLEDYCMSYPGETGCTKKEGCFWDWCGET